MKIASVYVGGWFQRTMLQLSEVYDFLRANEPKIKLSVKKLDEYRENLDLGSIEYGVSGEEYVLFTTGMGVTVKIFEDGLITLNNSQIQEETLLSA